METRKITIVTTKSQTKHVIMSAATTLGELKRDLRDNNIDYTDMTFYEGISKIELKDDSSVLPSNVPYKGQTTNELVFMLTTPNKKIRSGVINDRPGVYSAIKSLKLQNKCVERFGKNFTMCKTSDLIALINEFSPSNTTPEKEKVEQKKEHTNDKSGMPHDTSSKSTVECVDTKARDAISLLCSILKSLDVICEEDEDDVKNTLEGKKVEISRDRNTSPYSMVEINTMFDFVK